MCPECYSEYSRITPLIDPEECLHRHRQYVCLTCGRCICANRGLFPFKKFEIAQLYLRPVEALKGKPCGIFELNAYYSKMAKKQKVRKTYKIFTGENELEAYLRKNTNKTVQQMEPKFRANTYLPCSDEMVRELTPAEITQYLKEKEAQADKWRDFVIQYLC